MVSADLACRDAQFPADGRTQLPDDDVDVAAARGQQAEQALQGILAEVAPEQPPHVRLGKAEQARRLRLGNAALVDNGVDAADEVRFALTDPLDWLQHGIVGSEL